MGEDKLRDSESVEYVIETGSSRMLIGEILCLFLLQKLPILLAPFPSHPCTVESPANKEEGESQRQYWDFPSRQ